GPDEVEGLLRPGAEPRGPVQVLLGGEPHHLPRGRPVHGGGADPAHLQPPPGADHHEGVHGWGLPPEADVAEDGGAEAYAHGHVSKSKASRARTSSGLTYP